MLPTKSPVTALMLTLIVLNSVWSAVAEEQSITANSLSADKSQTKWRASDFC